MIHTAHPPPPSSSPPPPPTFSSSEAPLYALTREKKKKKKRLPRYTRPRGVSIGTAIMETTKLPPSSPSSPTSFSVPSAEKVDGFPRRSMRRARQRRSHSSSQFRYQSSQVELTPLPLLKGETLFTLPGRSIKTVEGLVGGGGTMMRIYSWLKFKDES